MNAAFIPARGGSKSIPLKNIKEFCGRPLIYWTLYAAEHCRHIDKIYVATDCEAINNTVNSFGFTKVTVIGRSEASASDTASTESAMLEFAAEYDFDNIVLIQATSPLLTSQDLDKGFELFCSEATDSVLSGVPQKRFNWTTDASGIAAPLNYDYLNRPRRQDFDGYYTENGAFYITSRSSLLESRCRISGNIRLCPMPEYTFFEIDEPSDWIIMEQLKYRQLKRSGTEIKMFVTDCDGVLTDGGMYYDSNGDVMKKFNTRDGMGISLLHKHGIITAVITGENSEIVKKRAEKLHINEVCLGISDKLTALKDLATKYSIDMQEIAYIGDDINDIECMKACGISACPSDAAESVIRIADNICCAAGGKGAVREFIEKILNNRISE